MARVVIDKLPSEENSMTNEEMTTKVEKAEHDITFLKNDMDDFRHGLNTVLEALQRVSEQQEKFVRAQAKMQNSQNRTDAALARAEEIVEKLAQRQFESKEQQARDRERIAALEESHNRVSKSLDHLTQTVDRYIASRNNGSNGQP